MAEGINKISENVIINKIALIFNDTSFKKKEYISFGSL